MSTVVNTENRSTLPKHESRVRDLFDRAGIVVGGTSPGDIQVRDDRFYKLFDQKMTLGFVQAYLQNYIVVPEVDVFFYKLFLINWNNTRPTAALIADILGHKYLNLNKLRRQYIVEKQYNLPTDIFKYMLGEQGAYTCGYWINRETGEELDRSNPELLDVASYNKYQLMADKLELQPGARVLDMGCGWGYGARFLAQERGAKVTAVTIASEQVKYGRELCQGLDVNFLHQSFEDPILDENGNEIKFDAVWCLGMFEHVGAKEHKKFMRRMAELVKPEAKMVIQTISFSKPVVITDVFIERAIFPDMTCSSPGQVTAAAETSNYWRVFDLHELASKSGSMYDPTLMSWSYHFNKHWEQIRPSITKEVLKKFEHTVGVKGLVAEDFRTIWDIYLKLCAGAYRSGRYPRLIQYVLGGPEQGLPAEVR